MWNEHISAVKSKMSRYIGIMYKLKGILPFNARKNIFHSFVQSHINYCSLIWGLGAKSKIDTLFSAQKKAIRALMPGYTINYYTNGICPTHTKPMYTDHKILTVPNIILKNILIFMSKIRNFPQCLPESIMNLISNDAPIPGSNHETCHDWLSQFTTNLTRNSIMFKGPLFYSDLIHKLAHTDTFRSLEICKNHIKKYLNLTQCSGDITEWSTTNMVLYNVPGLRKSDRKEPIK